MAAMRPAAEMKDSGVQWLGKIPNNWDTIRFKFVHVGANVGMSIDREYWSDDETDTAFYTAQINPIHVRYNGFPEWKYTSNYDLLLARNATPYVYLPVLRAAYTDHIIRVDIKPNYDRRYIRYCLQQSILCDVAEGVSLPTWSVPIWNRQIVPFISLKEQQAIADYLDDRCSKIDEIIAEATASIEEYKELKQAVIFEAVTKGLDKSVPMKESGDSWIGLCPVHYQIGQLSMLSTIVRGGSPRPAGDPRYYGGDIPFMRISDITRDEDIYVNYCVHTITEEGFSRTREVPPYTLLLTNSGATLGVPKITTFKTTFNDGIAAFLNIDDRLDIMFAYYYLKARTSFFLESASMGMGQPNLNTDIIGRTHIVLPPKEEQLRIVEYLKNKCESMNAIISEKQSLISDLQEYKKSLIYEVVTGKRRVV